MRKSINVVVGMFCVLFTLLLAACGGGSDNGGEASAVSGVVAAGAPVAGIVQIKDSSSPAKTLTQTIADDGSFSFDVSGLTPPFILKATGSVGSSNYTLYSFANGSGIANLNPLSSVALSVASGGLDPGTIFTTPGTEVMQTVSSKLTTAVTDIQTKLQALFTLYDVPNANMVTDSYIANHTGLDEVLDMITVQISAGTITIRNKATNAIMYTGQANDFKSGSFTSAAMPQPLIHPVISPRFPTAVVNAKTTFTADVVRTTNKNVTWSVVETGGGSITTAGIYTAPAVDGVFHVRAVSAANPTFTDTVPVKVVYSEPVSVNISPKTATVSTNSTKAFTATVTGTSKTAVTWSVMNAGGGSITTSGVYTAPSTAGTYHVKATSVSDTTKSNTATVTVTAPVVSKPFPIGTWVGPHNITITVNAFVNSIGTDNYYSGSVSYPAFSGGVVTISGNVISDMGAIDYVQKNALVVTATSAASTAVTQFAFTGDGTIDNNMTSPITLLPGRLIIVSSVSGYSYDERATFVKQ